MRRIVLIFAILTCSILFMSFVCSAGDLYWVDTISDDCIETMSGNDSYQIVDYFVPGPESHIGYTFVGYWLDPFDSSTDAMLIAGDPVYFEDVYEDFYIYLVYQANASSLPVCVFHDTVNPNWTQTIEASDGYTIDIFPSPPSHPGLTFKGWNDMLDGSGSYYTSLDFTVFDTIDDIDLFAIYYVSWTKVTSPGQTAIIEAIYGLNKSNYLGTPSRPGYTFKWWSNSENGQAVSTSGIVTQSATYYAVWESNTVVTDPPTSQPVVTQPVVTGSPNIDRDTVLLLADSLWDNFYTAFYNLTSNSLIFGIPVLTILLGLFVILVAILIVKLK